MRIPELVTLKAVDKAKQNPEKLCLVNIDRRYAAMADEGNAGGGKKLHTMCRERRQFRLLNEING